MLSMSKPMSKIRVVRDPELAGLPEKEALLIEGWADRVAAITAITTSIAIPTVKRFRLAGGTEEMFKKLEQHVCRSGNSFIYILNVVADLMRIGIVK